MTELNHEKLRFTDEYPVDPAKHPDLFRERSGEDSQTIVKPVIGFDGD